jgi:hypothetical protein
MIPVTAKKTAALAIARMVPLKAGTSRKAATATVADFTRNLNRAERREYVRAGRLPGSSRYAYPVPLGVDLVELVLPAGVIPTDNVEDIYRGPWNTKLTASVERALNDTATGAHELWFNDIGDAYLSFEVEGDAVLFRLALDA